MCSAFYTPFLTDKVAINGHVCSSMMAQFWVSIIPSYVRLLISLIFI